MPGQKKTQKFRDLLLSSNLEFLIEAHNGISAKIAEETGFKGLWAGGLAISAKYGVRDNNEASWTQFLETLEFMADANNNGENYESKNKWVWAVILVIAISAIYVMSKIFTQAPWQYLS